MIFLSCFIMLITHPRLLSNLLLLVNGNAILIHNAIQTLVSLQVVDMSFRRLPLPSWSVLPHRWLQHLRLVRMICPIFHTRMKRWNPTLIRPPWRSIMTSIMPPMSPTLTRRLRVNQKCLFWIFKRMPLLQELRYATMEVVRVEVCNVEVIWSVGGVEK